MRVTGLAAACVVLAAWPAAALAGDARASERTVTTVALMGAPAGVALAPPHSERSLGFRLPAGARQGRGVWYVLRLRYRLTFAPTTRPGRAYVMASTNGYTCAQLEFRVTRERGHPRVRWNAVDAAHGLRQGNARSG